jgi:peptide chain release factor subunit 1
MLVHISFLGGGHLLRRVGQMAAYPTSKCVISYFEKLIILSVTFMSELSLEIARYRTKKLVKRLEAYRGNGTSMISLIIPPHDAVARAQKLLTAEYGTAVNIKSRVNRQSVQEAITSAQERLKLYTAIPANGLAIYCGTVMTETGVKKLTFDLEPFRPINTSLYMCDNKFHVEALMTILHESEDIYGFIVMDGNGCLFATLRGNTTEMLFKFTVDLPKKHGRGGQSAQRFGRIREEKRHNYLRKVAEEAVRQFIVNDRCNVIGLIVAGSADFKTDLCQSDLFDPHLREKILTIVDVAYGGETGLRQAISLSSEQLRNVKFLQEKQLLSGYFAEIQQNTDKYCFGLTETFQALEQGAVEKLIVWEQLPTIRYTVKTELAREEIVYADQPPPDHGEIIDQEPLTDWITTHYRDYGAELYLVTDSTTEGAQFCRGFGGFGGLLRFRVANVAPEAIDDTDLAELEDYL